VVFVVFSLHACVSHVVTGTVVVAVPVALCRPKRNRCTHSAYLHMLMLSTSRICLAEHLASRVNGSHRNDVFCGSQEPVRSIVV
jgi:hypothetical protein